MDTDLLLYCSQFVDSDVDVDESACSYYRLETRICFLAELDPLTGDAQTDTIPISCNHFVRVVFAAPKSVVQIHEHYLARRRWMQTAAEAEASYQLHCKIVRMALLTLRLKAVIGSRLYVPTPPP